jgi:Nucleoside-diphosphate-sugar epimerases
VLHNLLRAGWKVVATSRRPRTAIDGVEWRVADLLQPWSAPEAFDAIFSCGPLDHFATWYQASAVQAPRVVAFGSTSGQVKQDSGDAAERDLSRRLREAEATVLQAAAARNAAATVLRPTLVYGAGRDRT